MHFALRILAAILLMVGAVLLILEIPTIVASGDSDLWDGLKVTVFLLAWHGACAADHCHFPGGHPISEAAWLKHISDYFLPALHHTCTCERHGF